MVRSLMMSRRFAPLFWCQFLSAFNDNVLKNALVFLILFRVGGSGAELLVTIAGALFVAPPLLLSGIAGELADRYDKALVARRLKLFEIAAAGLSFAGFALSSVPILFAALTLFSAIAALFAPVKYGILPDHLAAEDLPAGNALIEGGTFMAILFGTILGGQASAGILDVSVYGGLVIGFAVLCWAAASFIPASGEGAPHLRIDPNIFRSTGVLLRDLWADSRLWRAGVFISWFWAVGAVVLTLLPALVKNRLGGSEQAVTALLAVFSIGVGAGSGMASWLAAGRVILLPTPIAAILMGLCAIDLAFTSSGVWNPASGLGAEAFFTQSTLRHAALDLFGLAIGGGLFIVPVFTALQSWADPAKRARTIGAVNVLSSLFMVAGVLATAVLQGAGLGIPSLFGLIGLVNLVAAVLIMRSLPTSAFRDLLSIIFRAFYRLEIKGHDNIAKAGPNPIIALNHVSFLDAALALSLLDRDPVFAIDRLIAERWWVKPFLRLTRAMPIDPGKPMATRALINAVKAGDTLVIFPEGRLTVTGSLMKVYDGAGLIADKTGVSVVPVRIQGLERTPFSYLTAAQTRRGWWPKLEVTILEPVRLEIDPELFGRKRRLAAGAALYDVMSDMVFRTTRTDMTVLEAVFEAGHVNGWSRVAVEDPVSGTLTYSRLALGANILGRKLMPMAGEGAAIGVMLPTANGAAVTVLAVMSAGRVPAMINFTAGAANILASCRAANLETILTARSFVEKGKLEALVETLAAKVKIVYLEDVRAGIGAFDKLRGLLTSRSPLVARQADDAGAILFTSGSEGVPKGVVLSHRNMLSNVAQVAARIDFGRTDKVFSVLPVFHAFGLTAGMVLPLASGVSLYLYPSPLHYRIIPELIYSYNATALFGTDTFLAGYARSANAYDFRSLRYVVAGGEAVKEATRRIYMEKFGLRILEGYGITETAPVLAVNTPMFNRFGTVGRLLPGMESRLEAVPGIDEGGRLSVRGPNVMLGYLKADRPGTLEAPPEGWHDTGDIVSIDQEGFITIRGRAKRFAKIGGEMVSLAAVETVASELWPEAACAVTAMPDPRKGERLVLVTDRTDATRSAFQAFGRAHGLADIAMPAEILIVDAVPLLGSGKIDHPAVAKLVRDRRPDGGSVAAE